MEPNKESQIRLIIKATVQGFASGFSERHLKEVDDPEGTINMKIHNVFIAALGADIQYYSALSRSLDSSLGNMLEKMAIQIAELSYTVTQNVDGFISRRQTEYIATLLEEYKRHARMPQISDYENILSLSDGNDLINKRHDSDYYLFDETDGQHYLIELKIGGDLDNKKARSEKEALLEQYCILANNLKSTENIHIFFATAYNRYGEGMPWCQSRVLQFFSREELLISSDFWNMICKSPDGYNIVLDEYRKNVPVLKKALTEIREAYLPNN